MNQAQGQRRKHRITAVALVLFVVSAAVGIGYSMAISGRFGFGLSELCVSLQAAIVSWIFYAVMRFKFLRDPGYELAEGSYSDISWLNLGDNNIVLLEPDSVGYITFATEQMSAVADSYASDSSCTNLLKNQIDVQVNKIEWSSVTAIISSSEQPSLSIETTYGVSELQFLNVGTKEHALNYLRVRLPASATVSHNEDSNTLVVTGFLLGLLVLVVCALLVGSMALTTVLGGIASLFFPLFLHALYAPKTITNFRVGTLYQQTQESNMPPSTSSVVPVTKSF